MSTLNLLSLDAAIANTGYSVFKLIKDESEKISFTLSVTGVWKTNSHESAKIRVSSLLSQIGYCIETKKVDGVCIELTEFANFETDPRKMISRGSSLMKMFFAVGGVLGYIQGRFPGFPVETINPNSWQDQQGIKKIGKGSKVWSVIQANSLMKVMGSNYVIKKTEDHIADSINMGVYCIENLIHHFPIGAWK